MQNSALAGALHHVVRMIADNAGIRVKIGNYETAATDNKTVYLPNLPPDDDKAKVYAFGYVMHESGHIEDTDPDAWPKTEPLATITNYLEDVRCDTRRIKRFPGAARTLSMLTNEMVKDGLFSPPSSSASPLSLLQAYLCYRLYADVLGHDSVDEYGTQAEALLAEAISPNAVARIGALMYEIERCTSTIEVVQLAQTILGALQDEKDKAEEAKQPDASGQQGGQGGQQPQPGNDSSQQQGGDSGQGHDQSQGQSPENGHGQSGLGQGQATQEQADNLASLLSGAGAGDVKDKGEQISSMLGQISGSSTSSVGFPESERLMHGPGDNRLILGHVKATSNALRKRIERMMESNARTTITTSRTGNHIDTKKIYRLQSGDTRVFDKRVDGVALNTAVHLLIDRSGSMSGRIGMALDATLALHLSMDGIKGVSSSVAAFPHHIPNQGSDNVLLIADFGESPKRTAGRYGAIGVTGSTPMSEAMMWCAHRLWSRREERKILFVATDGGPDDLESAKAVIKSMQSKGIEVIGLGINYDTSHLIMESKMISDIREMPAAVFEMLGSKLKLRLAA
jgi:cobalamin biosynthesis protein CobT